MTQSFDLLANHFTGNYLKKNINNLLHTCNIFCVKNGKRIKNGFHGHFQVSRNEKKNTVNKKASKCNSRTGFFFKVELIFVVFEISFFLFAAPPGLSQ